MIFGMFAMQWDMSRCMTSFCEVAHHIFASSGQRLTGLLGMAHTLACCLLHDGLYSSQPVISLFQDSFGMTTRMFGHSAGNTSRYKYAVTTTKVDDTTATVFSNYNLPEQDGHSHSTRATAVGSSTPECRSTLPISAYHRHQSSSGENIPFLWEV